MLRWLALVGVCTHAAALEQLDSPTAAQWYMPLRDRPSLRLSGAWGVEERVAVRGQDASLERSGGFAQGALRLTHDAQSESWLRASGAEVHIAGGAVLAGRGALPERLADLRVGGFHRHVAADGRILGIDADVSSPSDRPYSGSDVIAYGATAFSFWPTTGMDGWQLGLRYDSNSNLLPGVPLPMVAYRWMRPESGFRAIVGIPFINVGWKPIDDWSLDASYFPVDRGSASVGWSPGSPRASMRPGMWTVRAGGAIGYENWLIADRAQRDERLTFRTVRLFMSGEWQPFPGSSAKLTAGRIVQRQVYNSDSAFSRGDDQIASEPAWYGSLALTFGW